MNDGLKMSTVIFLSFKIFGLRPVGYSLDEMVSHISKGIGSVTMESMEENALTLSQRTDICAQTLASLIDLRPILRYFYAGLKWPCMELS